MKLDALLKEKIVIVDGGMGSLLQKMGLGPGDKPENWNLLHPKRITGVHLDYLNAGADIVTANTFGANRLRFPDTLEEIIAAGMACAAEAVQKAGHGFAAMDLGPTGRLLKPHGDLDFEQAVSLFEEAAFLGARAGADLFIIETMSDAYEMKAAVLGAKAASDLPIIATFTLNEAGKLLTGGDIQGMAALLESLGVWGLGINCGFGPDKLLTHAQALISAASLPVLLSPNAGLPEIIGGETVYTVTPEAFAKAMEPALRFGLGLAGGCCGTTPAHIRALSQLAKDIRPQPAADKGATVITSGSRTVVFGKGCRMIGERINPTGKKRLQQALRDNDVDYVLSEAVGQMQAGADVLDVNVGLPGVDEAAWLLKAVQAIQAVCPLPLQLDTADPAALEGALRIYNGKPLINSVSGKQASMDAVFPLMKKYGGAVVALLLDEDGIPETAEGRLSIARRILDEAARHGIRKKDILFDGLTMTVSTSLDAALVTLETIRRVRDELHAGTVLGVSNVSFGLPERGQLNAAFLSMAVQNGLSGAILNPQSGAMAASLLSANALCGADAGFQAYLGRYAGQAAVNAPVEKSAMSLYDCVLAGLEGAAENAAKAALDNGEKPLDLIENTLIPVLDEVGRRYETGAFYLPQLLMSAAAAKKAFAAVQEKLALSGAAGKKGEKIVLATVEGDVHDIGKNIVKVVLQNYGFQVIDLGKDVKPEVVLDAVRDSGARLCGLSALMTTTVPAMERTIKLLKAHVPQIKIMAGGAVLTEGYAKQIGADAYCKDAVASVKYAREVFAQADGAFGKNQ